MSAPRSTPIRSDIALSPLEHALCRSAVWEALALGFRRPAPDTITRLAALDGATALAAAAAALDPAGKGELEARVRDLARAPTPSLADLERAYGRLFGHTARGLVPPYETEYGEDSAWGPPREMSDLGGFFRAFGLVVRADARERPDHVACECEFLAFLARKEAHAVSVGDDSMREESRGATRLFLRDHLGRWGPAFGGRLAREDRENFYGALGRLCEAFVAAECARAGVPAGPELLRLRSAPDRAPVACGPSPPCGDRC